jgi:hypothetical protein
LPTNRDFGDVNRNREHLKDFPLRIEQTGGTMGITSYRLAGGDNSSGGLTVFFQDEVGFLLTKYQLPENATFEQTVKNMRFYRTINDYL